MVQVDPFLPEAVRDLGVGGMPRIEVIIIGAVGTHLAAQDEVAGGDVIVVQDAAEVNLRPGVMEIGKEGAPVDKIGEI
jgi:hypothetical protein